MVDGNDSKANPGLEEFEKGDMDDDELFPANAEGDFDLRLIPSTFCTSNHYAHSACLEKMKNEELGCPRCQHAVDVRNIEYPGCKRYCEDVNGGFVGSSKIDSVLGWYEAVPKDEKVRVCNFG